MTADPVGDDVLRRLAAVWNGILRDGDHEGGIVSTPAEAFTDALVRMDLAVVPRAQTVETDGTGRTPLMVTVSSLVDAAAEHAAARRWAAADALLLHAAMAFSSPEMAAYRAVLSAMELLDRDGRAANLDAFGVVAADVRAALVRALTDPSE